MKAGRDLDFLISENVIGECAHRKHEKYVCQDDWGYLCVVCGSEEECPRYSTDISAAWEVIEKMKLLGWHYLINYLDDDEYTRVHHAAFLNQMDFSGIFHAYADTAPLAICLAALKATENARKPL